MGQADSLLISVSAAEEENLRLESQRQHPQTFPPRPSDSPFFYCYFDLSMAPTLSSEAVETVDVHAAKHLMCSGHRYLDVRTVDEFNKGHLENAINVPYMFFTPQGSEKNPNFVEQVLLICSKDDHIVVGCQSGKRSLPASVDLVNAGFKHAKNVGGGYAAWVENGFAVKKPQE